MPYHNYHNDKNLYFSLLPLELVDIIFKEAHIIELKELSNTDGFDLPALNQGNFQLQQSHRNDPEKPFWRASNCNMFSDLEHSGKMYSSYTWEYLDDAFANSEIEEYYITTNNKAPEILKRWIDIYEDEDENDPEGDEREERQIKKFKFLQENTDTTTLNRFVDYFFGIQLESRFQIESSQAINHLENDINFNWIETINKMKTCLATLNSLKTSTMTLITSYYGGAQIEYGDNWNARIKLYPNEWAYGDTKRYNEIWFKKNDNPNKMIHSIYNDEGADYFIEVIPAHIEAHEALPIIKEDYERLQDSRHLFKKFLKLLTKRRKINAILLDRYRIEGKPPLTIHYLEQLKLNKEFKNNYDKKNFGSSKKVFNLAYYYEGIQDKTPSKDRILRFRRLKELETETSIQENKMFYLLKSGFEYYKHTSHNYKYIRGSGLKFKSIFGEPQEELPKYVSNIWLMYDDLGSHYEWRSYRDTYFIGRQYYYDLTQNIYKSTYHSEDEKIHDWDIDDICRAYRRMNRLERRAIKEATGEYPKTYYSGHLDPDKFKVDLTIDYPSLI